MVVSSVRTSSVAKSSTFRTHPHVVSAVGDDYLVAVSGAGVVGALQAGLAAHGAEALVVERQFARPPPTRTPAGTPSGRRMATLLTSPSKRTETVPESSGSVSSTSLAAPATPNASIRSPPKSAVARTGRLRRTDPPGH